MKVYVAGLMAESDRVKTVQRHVVETGHALTHDWTGDLAFESAYASWPAESADIASADLRGVMEADAVIVVAPRQEPGRGLFVELGAALARAELDQLDHVVVVGEIHFESVFFFHPVVTRVADVDDWLTTV